MTGSSRWGCKMATKDIYLKLTVNRNTDLMGLRTWLKTMADEMRTDDTPRIYGIDVLNKRELRKEVMKE